VGGSEHIQSLAIMRENCRKIELRDILSEPLELMGEFNDKNDYENIYKAY
jgi:hypothetical protein